MAAGARVPPPPPPIDPRPGITSTPDQYASLVLIQQPGGGQTGASCLLSRSQKRTLDQQQLVLAPSWGGDPGPAGGSGSRPGL